MTDRRETGSAPEAEGGRLEEERRGRTPLIPPLERGRRRAARQSLRLLAGAILLPNAVLWLVGGALALPRPAVNLDYSLVALLHPWVGAAGGAWLAGVLALADAAVGGAYHYCRNPACLIQAAPDVLLLPRSFTLAIALGMVAGATALGWAVWRVLSPLPRKTGPNLLAFGGAVALSLGMTPLFPGPREDERAVLVGDFLDNAVIPALARATEFRGLVERPVPSATGPLFSAFAEDRPLPERVVLVVLESWGRFRDPVLNHLATAPLDDPALASAYAVEQGTVPRHGPTVKGEIRELCAGLSGSVRPDTALLPVEECLPALFAGRGYRSIGVHGFRGRMFHRVQWWPSLRFDSVYFMADIEAALATTRTCGTTWKGVCDEDAVRLLDRLLAGSGGPDPERLFLYWLSLNSHGPYMTPLEASEERECGPADAPAPTPVCVFLARHERAMTAVAELAAARADGRTAWIIVGDHPPLFHSTALEALVVQDSVPWIRLWPRGAAESGGPRGDGDGLPR